MTPKYAVLFLICTSALFGCEKRLDAADATQEPATTDGSTATPAALPSRPAGQIHPWNMALAGVAKIELCALDAVNGAASIDGYFLVPAGDTISFDGWVSTPDFKTPIEFSIVLAGANALEVTGVPGVGRDDVVAAYSAPTLQYAGYRIDASATELQTGDYSVALVQSVDGTLVACDVQGKIRVQ